VPQAIAYAQIVDLPPQAGLFAAFAGLLGVPQGDGDFFPSAAT
jgi:hypothetical protein